MKGIQTLNRCPKCNSVLEELEPNSEDMTDGQLANWDMGFNREFYCPKCKTFSSRDIEIIEEFDDDFPTPSQLEKMDERKRTSLNNSRIKGNIGEMWFENKLRSKGYKVRKTMYYNFEQEKCIFNEKGVENLLQQYSKNKKLLKLLRSFGNGYPDLICLKDGEVSFYEVKTNNSEVMDHQQQVINTLKSKGYEVKVIRLNVQFNVEENKDD